MHIPDGYLAPQTTVPALVGMVPLWSVAFRKVKKTLSEKKIPALALCAAFSFLVMMFNIPVAGGSSAHAVGAVLIAILLGPWAAVLSVSTALLIQALVFGDGGVLAFGINCLNMAVVMPFAGYAAYRSIAGNSRPGSRRNLIASFVGGYVGLNLAAFCASVEFGIQPLLFKAADGSALYCPYPLSVSVPSMMFAHGLIAGPIEAAVTTAAVAYLAKAAPELFAAAGIAPQSSASGSFWKRYKAMLIPLVGLVVLTPLGLIATGTAWGEWSTDELMERLGHIPQGLEMMADKWGALLPDYSLPALGSGQAGAVGGYLLSAVIGILLVAALILCLSALIIKTQKGKTKGDATKEKR